METWNQRFKSILGYRVHFITARLHETLFEKKKMKNLNKENKNPQYISITAKIEMKIVNNYLPSTKNLTLYTFFLFLKSEIYHACILELLGKVWKQCSPNWRQAIIQSVHLLFQKDSVCRVEGSMFSMWMWWFYLQTLGLIMLKNSE